MADETREFCETVVTIDLAVVAYLIAVTTFLFSKRDPFEPESNMLLAALSAPLFLNTLTVLVISLALAFDQWGIDEPAKCMAHVGGGMNLLGVLSAVILPAIGGWTIAVRENQERKLNSIGGIWPTRPSQPSASSE